MSGAGGTRLQVALLWLAATLVTVALSALIPPMQSPDEGSHLARAYLLSKGRLTVVTPPGDNTGGMVDFHLVEFTWPYLVKIAGDKDKKLEPELRKGLHTLRWTGTERYLPAPGIGYYFPLVYAPQALGFVLGQTFDLTIITSYRLARIFNLAACTALLILAFRVLRPPPLAIALLLLPMTAFQMLMPTLDALTNCIAVLALGLFMRRSLEDGPQPAWWKPAMYASLFLLGTTRVHLFPLLLVPYVLAWRKRSKAEALWTTGVLVAALAWTAYAMATTVDIRIPRTVKTSTLLVHYLLHPLEFVDLVAVTVVHESTFLSRSFIGNLGWLDALLADPWYPTLWIALGACLVASLVKTPLSRAAAERLALAAAAIGSVALVFLALLATWTPHPATLIKGLQGRYFLVPALMLAYSLARPHEGRAPRWPYAIAGVTGALSLWAMIATLLDRYH